VSDDEKIKEQLEYIERDAAREKKRKEILDKELVVKENRLNNELQRLTDAEKEKELAKNADYGALSREAIEKLKKENTDYMSAAKKKMGFINKTFDDAIPFYRKNLILVGGSTGDGKSTTAANIILGIIRQPLNDRPRRVLVLTNEEKTEDVYNRVLCLTKGWAYVNHDRFNDEQVNFFNSAYAGMSKVVTVVDNTYEGGFGVTTTLEGICRVFDNLLSKGEYYDAVILDYYQNVQFSTNDPRLTEYQVQAALAKRLDQYKNIYPAPIVVLAQVRPRDDANTPFKIRVEGSKVISNVCTCSVELVPNKPLRKTAWVIHKSRFNEAVGQELETGFEKGQHVMYTEEFRDNIARMNAKEEKDRADRSIKMPVVTENKEEKKDDNDPK